jgi:signal transduction histidine kinase
LGSPVLIEYGYLTGLRQWAGQLARRTGLAVDVRGEESAPRLAPHVEMALFRIVQEALNNVAKHARATRVVVTEEVHDDVLHLTIADNGIGFDPSQKGQPEGSHHWGLMNMSERALAVGGTCRISSQPGGGTRVIVEVNR